MIADVCILCRSCRISDFTISASPSRPPMSHAKGTDCGRPAYLLLPKPGGGSWTFQSRGSGYRHARYSTSAARVLVLCTNAACDQETCKAQLCRGWGQLGEALRRGQLFIVLDSAVPGPCRTVIGLGWIATCDLWSLSWGVRFLKGFGSCLVEVGTEGVKKLDFSTGG